MITIGQRITNYSVSTHEALAADEPPKSSVVQMHERLERPEALVGMTYKIKVPASVHALYVTINDMVLNPGTEHELRRPFEIFINSKNMDHFQWIVALTRIMSAVFRKGGDVAFLVDELHSVFDPRGGYFKSGGRFVPSLLAEIGDVLETHLRSIGLIVDDVDPRQQAWLDAKRAEIAGTDDAPAGFPSEAGLCRKCHVMATVRLDGCMTCLNCGDSVCG